MLEPVPTAALADASLRLGIALRTAPVELHPLQPTAPLAGPAQPVTHLGSVDVILDAIEEARPGSVLVVDNGGRRDEACVGDLLVLEAREAGLAAVVIWGLHRDTAQLREIGLPVFSLGATPFGPRRIPPAGLPMRSASLDGSQVSDDDVVFADDDGVLIAPGDRAEELVEAALAIQRTETAQADRMRSGASLRHQLDFAGYRERQQREPDLTLRRYLVERGDAIEV